MLSRLLLFVLYVLVATSGCAMRGGADNPPNTVGKLAQSGRQVIAAADSVLTGVDQLADAGTISKADAVKVIAVIGKIGKEGERLAQVLTVVDQTQPGVEQTKGLQQAGEILKGINRLVLEAGNGIGNDESRAKIVGLLGQITDVVVMLAALFPSTQI